VPAKPLGRSVLCDWVMMEPNVPAGPCGPGAPVSPLGPCGPVAPRGPVAPAGPGGPAWSQLMLNSLCGQVTGWVEVFPSDRHGNRVWAPCVTTRA
jgi:hypothetical protein